MRKVNLNDRIDLDMILDQSVRKGNKKKERKKNLLFIIDIFKKELRLVLLFSKETIKVLISFKL